MFTWGINKTYVELYEKVEELKFWECFFFLVDEWQFQPLYSCQKWKV